MKLLFFYLSLFAFSCSNKLPRKPNFFFSISSTKKIHQVTDLTFQLNFFNNTKSPIQLLDKFEPVLVFCKITFTSIKNGQIFDPSVSGKIDMFGEQKYITILPNKFFKKELDFSQVLRKYNVTLPEGSYIVKIIYKNQYGKDCIKGQFPSNEIEITIKN